MALSLRLGRGSGLHKEKKQSEQHSSLCILLCLQYASSSHPCHRAFHQHTLQLLTLTPPCFSLAHPPDTHTHSHPCYCDCCTLQPWVQTSPSFLQLRVRDILSQHQRVTDRLSLVVEDQRNGEIWGGRGMGITLFFWTSQDCHDVKGHIRLLIWLHYLSFKWQPAPIWEWPICYTTGFPEERVSVWIWTISHRPRCWGPLTALFLQGREKFRRWDPLKNPSGWKFS